MTESSPKKPINEILQQCELNGKGSSQGGKKHDDTISFLRAAQSFEPDSVEVDCVRTS